MEKERWENRAEEMDEIADKTATATTTTDKIECGSAGEKRLRIGEEKDVKSGGVMECFFLRR